MPARPQYSDAAIVIGLRVKAVELGRKRGAHAMVPMTAAWWDANRDPANHPPSTTIIRRYGSWTKACEAAGLPVRVFEQVVGRPPRWTDEEMLAFVTEYLTGKRRKDLTFAGYDAWSRLRKARPSGAAVLKRFSSWSSAKARALE